MRSSILYWCLLFSLCATETFAQPGGADPATNAVDLDINNVRARIMNGNDMFWDLVSSPRYEVPKVTQPGQVKRHTLFAASLWIGGLDDLGNIHAAATTYRQTGSDFYPGPMGDADYGRAKAWDQIWELTRKEIDDFKKSGSASSGILDWPAHAKYPNMNEPKNIAPFIDVNGDGKYNPQTRIIPIYGATRLYFTYPMISEIITR